MLCPGVAHRTGRRRHDEIRLPRCPSGHLRLRTHAHRRRTLPVGTDRRITVLVPVVERQAHVHRPAEVDGAGLVAQWRILLRPSSVLQPVLARESQEVLSRRQNRRTHSKDGAAPSHRGDEDRESRIRPTRHGICLVACGDANPRQQASRASILDLERRVHLVRPVRGGPDSRGVPRQRQALLGLRLGSGHQRNSQQRSGQKREGAPSVGT
mmetsp:Transcript_25526/g.49669  ORF Transcript_25526/g.49669 Transcript_25526/m.49669 type:complete len:211 (+) Transcript_25526:621-1253(+)